MADTRALIPFGAALRWLMEDAEWAHEITPGGYANFQKVMGRLPYTVPLSKYPPIRGGAAGAITFTNEGRLKISDGTIVVGTDTFKAALFTSSSNIGAGSTTYAGLNNEVANANGYTTGGISVTLTNTTVSTTNTMVDVSVDPVWTASGGSIVARFVAYYEVSGHVLCYALLDSTPANVTATDGNTLTVAASGSGLYGLQ